MGKGPRRTYTPLLWSCSGQDCIAHSRNCRTVRMALRRSSRTSPGCENCSENWFRFWEPEGQDQIRQHATVCLFWPSAGFFWALPGACGPNTAAGLAGPGKRSLGKTKTSQADKQQQAIRPSEKGSPQNASTLLSSNHCNKFFYRRPGCADKFSQRSRRDFAMIRHRKRSDRSWLGENHVASSLSPKQPSQTLECLHHIAAGNHRQLRQRQPRLRPCARREAIPLRPALQDKQP